MKYGIATAAFSKWNTENLRPLSQMFDDRADAVAFAESKAMARLSSLRENFEDCDVDLNDSDFYIVSNEMNNCFMTISRADDGVPMPDMCWQIVEIRQ